MSTSTFVPCKLVIETGVNVGGDIEYTLTMDGDPDDIGLFIFLIMREREDFERIVKAAVHMFEKKDRKKG